MRSGTFLWAPAPAVADVSLEQLRIARIKRQSSLHVFVCPRLLCNEWLKQMNKMSDFSFEIPVGSAMWPTNMHEKLIVAVALPFIRHPPWQLRGTPKVLRMVREVRGLLKTEPMAKGNILFKFLQLSRRFSSMPQDVVWRMLHFKSRDNFSCTQVGGPTVGEKRRGSSSFRGEMGKKRSKTSGLSNRA